VFHLDGAFIKATELLRVDIALLSIARIAVVDFGLPGRNAFHEHLLDVFKGLSSCLGEQEECVNCHRRTENAEDYVDPPLDVDEGGRDKVRQSEVLES
jgi:hypothetical protein